jgi:hypothetical protein
LSTSTSAASTSTSERNPFQNVSSKCQCEKRTWPKLN